jgi:hypothetical protein
MNPRIRIVGLALAALTMPLSLACHGHATAPPSESLVQTVRIEPAEPRKGDTLTILSTIENRGSRPRSVTYRICYLPIGGDLSLASPLDLVRCAAVSVTTYLAPGQRVEGSEWAVVMSDPGVYTLTVDHMLDPPRTATIKVHVRE